MSDWKNFKQKYPFRKWLFNAGIFFLLLLLLLVWVDSGFQDPRSVYYGKIECIDRFVCENPVYYCNPNSSEHFLKDKTCDVLPREWFESEFMLEGQVFELKAPFVIKHFGWVAFVVLGFCFGLNHYLNKRRKK